jgi:hypothetical protein
MPQSKRLEATRSQEFAEWMIQAPGVDGGLPLKIRHQRRNVLRECCPTRQ